VDEEDDAWSTTVAAADDEAVDVGVLSTAAALDDPAEEEDDEALAVAVPCDSAPVCELVLPPPQAASATAATHARYQVLRMDISPFDASKGGEAARRSRTKGTRSVSL
jgi:hypothetical protein